MGRRTVTVAKGQMGSDLSILPRTLKPVETLDSESIKPPGPQIEQSLQPQETRKNTKNIAPKPAKEVNGPLPIIKPYVPPRPDHYYSPYASSTSPAAQSTNVTLAAISEKVNKILAPVHALGLKQINNLSPSKNLSLSHIPSNMPPHVPLHIPPQTATPSQPQAAGTVVEQEIITTVPLPRPEVIPPAITPNATRTGGRRGRGPRRRGSPIATGVIKVEPSASDSLVTLPSSRSRGIGRGSRSRGSRGGRASARGSAKGSARSGKRKRVEGGEEGNETDSSEEVTSLPTQSRSGRKIFQAANGTPIIKIDDVDSPQFPSAAKTGTTRGSGKKRASTSRTPGGASAVCKNCGRGHSPISNAIVFCDGCNKPWHMFCHDPPIKPEIVRIKEKEWFCSDCTVLKEERAKLSNKVAGGSMTLFEKRKYLQGLPQGDLVSLLLHACTLHPNLPIFAPKPTSNAMNPENAAQVEEQYEDDYVLPYPKAGNGVRLRPEREDLGILLDDDTVAFSHAWKGVGNKMGSGVRSKTLTVAA